MRGRSPNLAAELGLALALVMLASTNRASAADRDLGGWRPEKEVETVHLPALVLEARFSIEGWVAGKTAGQDLGNVFSAGPGVQLDLGLVVSPGLTVYIGWDHAFYGTGSKSPYADLPTSDARGDLYMIGLRAGCKDPSQLFGFEMLADVGYRQLRAEGSDNAGGSASISLPAVALRPGVGACIRATRGFLVEPTFVIDGGIPVGSYSGDVVVHGVQRTTSGDLSTGSVMIAVVPGVSFVGELPF